MSEEYTNLENARHDDQRRVMEQINDALECPFCPDNLHRYHEKPILRAGEHWTITENQWPYAHTRHHILAISAYHAETLNDLRDGSFDELQKHLQWAEFAYEIASGGIAMRFGDITKNGATVRHLHMHLIVPSQNKPADQTVRFKIS